MAALNVVLRLTVVVSETWDQHDKRRILSRVQNLMMWDDHEIRNDWGTFAQDTDRESVVWRIAKCARRAYWQYQRQLWDDVDWNGALLGCGEDDTLNTEESKEGKTEEQKGFTSSQGWSMRNHVSFKHPILQSCPRTTAPWASIAFTRGGRSAWPW
jgi:hypothetical protein